MDLNLSIVFLRDREGDEWVFWLDVYHQIITRILAHNIHSETIFESKDLAFPFFEEIIWSSKLESESSCGEAILNIYQFSKSQHVWNQTKKKTHSGSALETKTKTQKPNYQMTEKHIPKKCRLILIFSTPPLQMLERVGECEEGAVERFMALCAQRGFRIEEEEVERNVKEACGNWTQQLFFSFFFFFRNFFRGSVLLYWYLLAPCIIIIIIIIFVIIIIISIDIMAFK